MARYIELLSTEERAAAMRMGIQVKAAELGIKAADINVSPAGVTKTIAALSLMAGIPAGVAAHVIHKQVSKQRGREKELQEKIKHYREATSSMESALQPTNAPQQVGGNQQEPMV